MVMRYLWDTNIVIYYLQQQLPTSAEEFIDKILQSSSPIISVISEIELLCWKTQSESDIKVLQEFIDNVLTIDLEQNIKLKTAEIRRTYSIKLPDAVIAATALEYDLILISRNKRDFDKIAGLKIIDPFIL
jgi:predicted nucleic acid-binding protein